MSLLLAAALAQATIAQMKWERRILLIVAQTATDPQLAEQRRILAAWRKESDARDLTIVEIVGDRVSGAADSATAVRRKYRLPAGFTAILIGKDGGEKLRSPRPFPAAALAETIDAMPMRRAGQR
ncbi:DUF4174 domain-containing protein [Sphingomonas ginsenosidivorax]|uniref:DUF4174 domain-containing protein n=1 Tax=Sphingomonas ginsenosidivorax TaxID=862135 RepID=A0A5C6UHV6_9SPHN|nr:DUF4174 domain-containing protein [Sphingomonas ginsenosidivorax]TXC71645.1 DUF4174 domain-containing protein [Sphingomonas ginsenosidivorax]